MVQSMTGYASSSIEQGNYQINIEAKSVNNRFFSLSYRSIGGLDKYEELVKGIVQKKIIRGSVNIFIKLKRKLSSNHPRLDKENICAVVSQMHEISTELKISKIISMDTLLRIPGTIADNNTFDENEEDENLKSLLTSTLEQTIKQLVNMRENEGQRLIEIINTSLEEIIKIEAKIKVLFNDSQKEIAKDLLEKVNKTLQMIKSEIPIEAKDIVREVVMLAEKYDIAEEINRIKSHITETKKALKENGQIGKKLDFLCQELSREFNTICSKTKKIEISQLSLEGKLEVEKIREQVQNIE